MTHTIQPHELPARLRMLADEMKVVGDACAYFGGFGSPTSLRSFRVMLPR